MPCYSPLSAYRLGCGSISFSERGGSAEPLQLPCGKCLGCQLERARQWAVRCTHEAQLHLQNCFVTLTYSDENLPQDNSLNHEHFQKFMKRLRKKFPNQTIRFLMCGEYGDNTKRPHYHACLFGVDFDDKKPYSKSKGNLIYESQLLETLWGHGFCTVAPFSPKTAGYTARYAIKAAANGVVKSHNSLLDVATGEYVPVKPPYLKCSLRPGIGALWFDKFETDVTNSDHVVINGTPQLPPRYYDKLLKRKNPLLLDDAKIKREHDAYPKRPDNVPSRLAVKLAVKKAQTNVLTRK